MEKLNESMKMDGGKWTFTIRDAKTGKVKRTYEYFNLIPTIGRATIAKALAGSASAIGEIEVNYTSLGDSVTAPANGDTTLGNELYRKIIASGTFAGNVLYLTAFYTAGEVTSPSGGTLPFREAGLHINGTGTVDTGDLFSHVAINVTKTNTETLTIDYTITIT